MTWMQTYHGRKLDFVDVILGEIDVRDIARSLARAPRFVGHTEGPSVYSVAEHSFWVARLVERWAQSRLPSDGVPTARASGRPRALALAALLHDASEAYTGDISRPLKLAMRQETMPTRHGPPGASAFDVIEARLQSAILTRFAPLVGDDLVALHDSAIIKDADMMMLAAEHKSVVPTSTHAWQSTEGIDADEVLKDHRFLSAHWPQGLRFPMYGTVDWADIFLLEFARIVGSAS